MKIECPYCGERNYGGGRRGFGEIEFDNFEIENIIGNVKQTITTQAKICPECGIIFIPKER